MVGPGFRVHPWLRPVPCSSPFRLSPHGQVQSSPQVCALKPEFQHPALPTPVDTRLRLGSIGQGPRSSVQVLPATNRLLRSPPGLWNSLLSSWPPRQWRGFPGCRNLSSFTPPSQECKSFPDFFFFFFLSFFHSTRLHGDLSCDLGYLINSASVH